MTWTVRPLDKAHDADQLASLWSRALPTWPIGRDRLLEATSAGHVAVQAERIVGAVAIHASGASIRYLVVDPDVRRRGIGSALHAAAVASLDGRGHARLLLGWGGRPYIWPGIPRDLRDAERFFVERGWTMKHVSADLAQDLTTYERPASALERAAAAEVTFALCRAADANDLLAYEAREHPTWIEFFREHIASDPTTILLGRDAHGMVVTALLMETPPRYLCRWSTMLGDDAAEIGCVGVAAHRNGEGIGTALMALATEHIRRAGARVAYLSWTVRWSFYERLGYRVWRDYQMAERPL